MTALPSFFTSALWHEIRTLDTSENALRSFGRVVGAVLVGIAVFIAWRRGWAPNVGAAVLAGLGTTLLVLGQLAPAVLKPVHRVWMALALVLGFVMTRVILTLVFFLVITPTGLVFRLLRKDPLHRHPDPARPTYWIPKTYHDPSPKRLERLF
jgi:hypothetical protein